MNPPTTVFISISWNHDDTTIEGLLTPEEAEYQRVQDEKGREFAKAQHKENLAAGRIMKGTPFVWWQGSGLEGPFEWNGERWERKD